MAIGLAVASGVPIGILLYASTVPFGPVLVGWFVALVGALVVPGVLCILATHHYVIVGLGYAAGVAASTVIAGLVAPEASPIGGSRRCSLRLSL